MFSFFNRSEAGKEEKKSNDLQTSIFEDNNDTIPTPEKYPLQYFSLKRDVVGLEKSINALSKCDPLIPDKMKPINIKDHHGYTALHLCVLISFDQGVDILIKNGASPTVRRY